MLHGISVYPDTLVGVVLIIDRVKHATHAHHSNSVNNEATSSTINHWSSSRSYRQCQIVMGLSQTLWPEINGWYWVAAWSSLVWRILCSILLLALYWTLTDIVDKLVYLTFLQTILDLESNLALYWGTWLLMMETVLMKNIEENEIQFSWHIECCHHSSPTFVER